MNASAAPTGTVTLLFTDVEGSTRLLQHLSDQAYVELLDAHRTIVRGAVERHDGFEVGSEGDGFFFSFAIAGKAVAAVLEAQRALESYPWPADARLRVRMGLHTGEVQLVAGEYVGLAIHHAKRLSSVAHGGQTLVSRVTRDLADTETELRRIGTLRLKDFDEPQEVYQLTHPDLDDSFPPLRTVGVVPNNLPTRLSSFVGRTTERRLVRDALGRSRLVTLTGPGGSGKTRTAIEVASEVGERFRGGAWMADLARVSEPELVLPQVARTLGLSDAEDAVRSIARSIVGRPTLLVLDNCEHLIDACARAAFDLLAAASDLTVLATSRGPLHVAGETVIQLPPLEVSDGTSEAAALFVDRARQHDVTFDAEADDEAVREICRLTDGLPLAIELAAAHTRVLSVAEIARRLGSDRFRMLRTSERTTEGRHATLEATVEWGYDLLSDEERRLLARLSIFSGGFTLEAAERICSGDGVLGEEVFDLVTRLVDRSFVARTQRGGATRYWLLETIRQYAFEKLPEVEARAPRDAIALVREGETWRVGRPGAEVRVKDRLGFAYLAALVGAAGQERHALELAGSSRALDGATAHVLDGQALRSYRARIKDLEQQIADAQELNDPVRTEAATLERDELLEELSKALGLGGRSRRQATAAERARVSVTKAIRSAIDALAEHDRDIARHLDASVSTGLWCAYHPSPGMEWVVEP